MPNKAEATPEAERINRQIQQHIQSVQRFCQVPATSRDARDKQRMYADVVVLVTLRTVCDLLPEEVQASVRQVLDLHETIWYPPAQGSPNISGNPPA